MLYYLKFVHTSKLFQMPMLKKSSKLLSICHLPSCSFLGPQPLLLRVLCVRWRWCTDMQCDSLCWSGDRFGSRVTRTWNRADRDCPTEHMHTHTDTHPRCSDTTHRTQTRPDVSMCEVTGWAFVHPANFNCFHGSTWTVPSNQTHTLTSVFHYRGGRMFINKWTNKWARQLITHPPLTLTQLMYTL